MKTIIRILPGTPFALLLGLLSALPAFAQDNAEEGEVVVIGELNRAEVTQFIEEAEDQLYAIFNANNDDDRFDIECGDFTPTGSHIKRRVCEPRFMTEARAENVTDSRFTDQTLLTDTGLRADQQANYEELQEKMEELSRNNAQFREIAGILQQLRARLAQLTD
ncbi:MAG: hypothetical protein MRY76_04675 [Pseudomonadales bacterium]|nr:hypothetical protein [Pseudomonadales bacterium]